MLKSPSRSRQIDARQRGGGREAASAWRNVKNPLQYPGNQYVHVKAHVTQEVMRYEQRQGSRDSVVPAGSVC